MPVASGATSVMLNSPWQSSAGDSPPKMKSSSSMRLRSGATNRMWPRMRVPSGSVMGSPLLTVTVSTPSGIATAELLQVLLLVGGVVGGVESAHHLLAEVRRHEARHDAGDGDRTREPRHSLGPADLVHQERGDDGQAEHDLDDGSDGDLGLRTHAASSGDDVESVLGSELLQARGARDAVGDRKSVV